MNAQLLLRVRYFGGVHSEREYAVICENSYMKIPMVFTDEGFPEYLSQVTKI